MFQQPLIKFLMKLREVEIEYDPHLGATFKELCKHPDYTHLDRASRIEIGLQWARQLYNQEMTNSSFERWLATSELCHYFYNARILDIGCYLGGKSVQWLEKYKGKEIHGIDIDPEFIMIANQFAVEKKVNAQFKVNFAESLAFPNEFFDTIVSENTLEHVRDVQQVLHECWRVLKPNGYLIVSFPSFWGPFSHHLNLVTQTPCIHWFFNLSSLLKAYFSILDERGERARWYRRERETPLPFEKGYSLNGMGASRFKKLINADWIIIHDGYKKMRKNKNMLLNYLVQSIKFLPYARDLFMIKYVLQKR